MNVCVCATPCHKGQKNTAGGPRAHHTARANEALYDVARKTYLQTSSWVQWAQLDWSNWDTKVLARHYHQDLFRSLFLLYPSVAVSRSHSHHRA